MAKTRPTHLRRGEIVFAREDLPNVPAGTRGRVMTVTGLTWIRYRVDFDNGVSLGSLDRRFLARSRDGAAEQHEASAPAG